MKRVNLLVTDQSSSGNKMTTTGQASHAGSTQAKATKSLFSHFMFLAGLLLITLLTSGKVYAQESYTVTLADAENCGLTVSPATTDGNTKKFTLTATDQTNNKLPDALESVVIGENKPLTAGDETDGYTYSNGTLTIGSGVTIDANIVITASAVAKSTDASLSALTYSISSMSITDQSIKLTEGTYAYTVALDQFVANETAITLTPTVTATDLASVTTNNGVTSYSGITSDATITVAAENASTRNYTITFTSKDKLATVSEISVSQLTERFADAASVITALGTSNEEATVTSTKKTVTSLPITWSYSEEDNESNAYNATAAATNNFRWTLNDLGELLNPENVAVTGTVSVTNAAASNNTVLSSLTYKIGADGESTAVTADLTETGDQTYAVELPVGTAADASIKVNVACDDNATAKLNKQDAATEFPIQLTKGKATLALIITAEDGSTTRNVTINFTTAETEQITSVTGIEAYTLLQAVATSDDVIKLLEENLEPVITSNGSSTFAVKWEYKIESNNENEHEGVFQAGSGSTNTFDWKIVKVGDEEAEVTGKEGVDVSGTIVVTNHTTSTDATLNTLQYKIGDGAAADITIGNQEGAEIAITVPALPFGTTAITLLATPTDPFATVAKVEEPEKPATESLEAETFTFPVAISADGTTYKLKVTAEDGTTAKTLTLTFSVDKEKITAVTVPATYKLPAAADDAAAAIALLADMEGVVITTNGTTPTKLSWTYESSKNGSAEYSNEGGKTNIFSWSAVRSDEGDALDAAAGVTIQGTTTVTNFMLPITGDQSTTDVKITTANPVDKIGDGTTATTVKSIDIAAGVTTEQLTINKATIVEKLDLKESVGEIILNEAIIPEVILAASKTTTLTLQSGNAITKITNAGTLTLKDAAIAVHALAIETRAALANTGAVETVDNNGVFTDETATIVLVGGDADLSVTSLPKDQSTAGSSATLTVAAVSTNGTVSYKWQKYTTQWVDASGTEETLTINKAMNGTTKYRCEVKSTNSAKVTTLYTPAVAVRFYTNTPSDPSEPSTPTYTVSLDKVAGATFSQGETTTVDQGDDFSFKITLDKDYDQSKPVVTVDGKAIQAAADSSYTIKNIQKDIKIIVSGIVKNTATGIEDITENSIRVWSVGSTLYIHTPEAADAYIVNATGMLMDKVRVSSDYSTQMRAGFYIVRINNFTKKVIIR